MYKLLLATDRQAYADVFSKVETFENLGFRAPRIVNSVEAAIECLKKHHIDAIAYHFDGEKNALLFEHLQQNYPIMPIFEAAKTVKAQAEILLALRTLLNKTHADFSDDKFDEADMMMLCRHEFFRQLLSEAIDSEKLVESSLLLLRSSMDGKKPCVVLDMELPDGEEYFQGRWHYGADRLEVALRNFFGREMIGMRILPSVISPDAIRVLACPLLGSDNTMDSQSITGAVYEHAKEALEHVKEYLALDVKIVNMRILPNLSALVQKI